MTKESISDMFLVERRVGQENSHTKEKRDRTSDNTTTSLHRSFF